MNTHSTSSPTSHPLYSDVVLRILELGAELVPFDKAETPLETKDRLHFLLDASLVCSSWNAIARSLLWRSVNVDWDGGAQKLLASSEIGKHQTQSLRVKGILGSPFGVKTESFYLLLENLRGLKDLRMDGMFEDPNFFLSDSLKDLKSLTLNHTILRPIPITNSPTYSLHFLSFSYYSTPPRDNDLNLYSIFSASLTTLRTLNINSTANQTANFSTFLSSTTSLKSFTYIHPFPTAFIPSFSNLYYLEYLSLKCSGPQISEIVKLLPRSSLKRLELRPLTVDAFGAKWESVSEELIQGLWNVVDCEALRRLKKLELGGEGDWFQKGSSGPPFREILRAKGVEVVAVPRSQE